MSLMCAVMIGTLLAIEYWRYGRWGHAPTTPFSLSRFVPLGVLLLVTSVGAVIASWRRRMPVLGYESLHPVTRKMIRRDVFLVIAWDLAPLLPGLIVVGLLMLAAALSPEFRSLTWIATVLASCAGLAFVAYVFTLWCVLIRRTWLVVLMGSVVYVALIATVGICAAWYVCLEITLDPLSVRTVAAFFSLLAVLALRSAWRRWLQMEFA